MFIKVKLTYDRKQTILLYFFSVFILTLGGSILIPIVPYYVIDLNLDMKTYGLLHALSQGFKMLIRLLFPSLMSIIGYFRAYGLGIVLSAFSQSFYIYSEALGGSVFLFSLGYVLSSLRRPVQIASRTTIIARYFKSSERAKAMGIISSVGMLATVIGPYIGSYLYENLKCGYFWTFASALAVTLMAGAPALILSLKDKTIYINNDKTLREVEKIAKVIKHPILRKILLILSLDGFIWSISTPFTRIYYAKVLNARLYELATINMIVSVIPVMGFPLFGIISDKIKRRVPFLILSEIAGLLFFALILQAKEMTLVYIASIFLGLVIAFWGPIASTYITEQAEKQNKELIPSVIGAWGFITMLAKMPGSAIGGILFDFNPKLPFTISAIGVLFITFILAILPEE